MLLCVVALTDPVVVVTDVTTVNNQSTNQSTINKIAFAMNWLFHSSHSHPQANNNLAHLSMNV